MLYNNRAAALLMRDWEGDAMLALRDAEEAIRLDPGYHKAHFRRIKALRKLGQSFSVKARQLCVWLPHGGQMDSHKESRRPRGGPRACQGVSGLVCFSPGSWPVPMERCLHVLPRLTRARIACRWRSISSGRCSPRCSSFLPTWTR